MLLCRATAVTAAPLMVFENHISERTRGGILGAHDHDHSL